MFSDSSGIGRERRHYFPFGEEALSSGGGNVTMGFTGHELDANDSTGTIDDLTYMMARYQHPQLGRFLSTDPVNSAKPPNPISWNKYAYVGANPLKLKDPDGRQSTRVDIQLNQDIGHLLNKEIDQKEYLSRIRARGAAGGIGLGIVTGVAYGPQALLSGRLLFLRPEVQLTAARIVTEFADDLATGGSSANVTVITQLDNTIEAGRALSTATGEGAAAVAATAREGGRFFQATLPKALIDKLEAAQLVERRVVEMNGVVGEEIRFSAEAMEELAKFFTEITFE